MSKDDIIRLSELPLGSKYSVRVAAEDRTKLGAVFGIDFPLEIGGVATADDVFALCLGPDEWELSSERAGIQKVSKRLQDISEPSSFSVVDVSHRDRVFQVSGPFAETVLNAACPANLGAMDMNSCRRTVFDGVQIVLMKRANDLYRLDVWRSFAPHVLALLRLAENDILAERQCTEESQ